MTDVDDKGCEHGLNYLGENDRWHCMNCHETWPWSFADYREANPGAAYGRGAQPLTEDEWGDVVCNIAGDYDGDLRPSIDHILAARMAVVARFCDRADALAGADGFGTYAFVSTEQVRACINNRETDNARTE